MNTENFSTRATCLAALVVCAVTGCASHLQTQLVGRSTAIAGPSAAPALVAEIPVPADSNAHELRYVVVLPRAIQFRYQASCPGGQHNGSIGETFDHYRTRRLSELESQRRAQANLIGSLVGALAPPVRATVPVAGPSGSGTVTGEVNPGAAAAQAARAALPPASLPPGDTGATVVRGAVDVGAATAGRCVLALTVEPSGQDVSGAQLFVELVRIVDLDAEGKARKVRLDAEADQRARALRVWLLGSLQRAGADPTARARARAAAEARAQAEAARRQAAVDEENRRRQVVVSPAELARRQRDEDRRLREQAAAADRARLAAIARQAGLDLRLAMLVRLRSLGAADDFQRKRDEAAMRAAAAEARRLEAARAEAAERLRQETQAALDLRVLAKLRLRRLGAVDRPPCPPPPPETPPPLPFTGAVWIAGRHDWNGAAWVWWPGYYQRPPEAGAIWLPPLPIHVDGTLVIRPGRWVRVTVTPR